MNLSDVFSAKSVASVHTQVASNNIPYLGAGLFPAKKKMGLDLKWVKTSKGLPVSLAPAPFDTNSAIRSREGAKIDETEMAYFKESMLVKEVDEQEIMRVQEASDPYAQEVLDRIYNDAETLVDGAMVVPERMRMQLLNPISGHPQIVLEANGTKYAYNYDKDGKYATENYVALDGTSKWTNEASDPIKDVSDAIDAVEAKSGARPEIMIVNKATMNVLKKNPKVRSYILAQNVSANVVITDAKVKEIFSSELGLTIVVYAKKFKNENGTVESFFNDGFVSLVPNGALGNTWFGTTPEERTLLGDATANVSIVETGIAVTVTKTNDPVHTKTTVSEIVLPSFERMDETFCIKAF